MRERRTPPLFPTGGDEVLLSLVLEDRGRDVTTARTGLELIALDLPLTRSLSFYSLYFIHHYI